MVAKIKYTDPVIAGGRLEDLEKENSELKVRIAKLEEELASADKENATLEREGRDVRAKFGRLMTRLENTERLLAQRTTALCALIELPDPRWVPKNEDMKIT